MKKREFFLKLSENNFNNELEKVIENKSYPVNTKNLLLSMLYKIELGYKDYETVKRIEISKGQFIKDIINIIENDCQKIQLVEPNSKKGEVLSKYGMTSISNSENKSIISFPTEKDLLFAIEQIQPNSFKIKEKYYIINQTLSKLLKVGNSINGKEVIRDFNGFSWNVETNDIENFEYNLIFQNLNILLGYSFMFEWKNALLTKKDYLYELKTKLENDYAEFGKEFYELLLVISIVLNMRDDKSVEKNILKQKKEIDREFEIINNKTEFLDKISENKKTINKKIRQLDKIILNKKILEKTFNEKNQKRKNPYKSITEFESVLKEKRKKLVEELESYTELMNPRLYNKNVRDLESKKEILDKIDESILNDEWLNYQMLELEKLFIGCMKLKIEDSNIRAEISRIIYDLRYYKQIPINKNNKIGDNEELKRLIDFIEDLLITKANQIKVLNTISKNEIYNNLILKEIFNSKIINLQRTELEIVPKYDKLQLNIYEAENLEKQIELGIKGTAEKIHVKANKKLKVFA